MFPSEILVARTYKNTTPRRLKISPPRPPRLRGATAVRRAESSCWILPPMISGQKQFCCARHPKDADAGPSADNRKSTRPSTTGQIGRKEKTPSATAQGQTGPCNSAPEKSATARPPHQRPCRR